MLHLVHTSKEPTGIWGKLLRKDGTLIAFTLEHAYPIGDTWEGKIPAALYACVRGKHQLSNGKPFETYEIMGVPGHTGILFHTGNLAARDSEGCVLVGSARYGNTLIESVKAFKAFMELVGHKQEFYLVVEDTQHGAT